MVRAAKDLYAKEYPYRVELLNILATYGGEVGEEKSFAEIMEAKVERSKDRAERHREYADNAAKKAADCMNSAHQILDIIPMGQLSWSAIIQKAGIGEIWPGWTAISKKPGRRTKRLHTTSIGPEHQHPSNAGPLIWLRLSGAFRGLRLISGDITGIWINKNSGRNMTATLGSPERAWNIARNRWMRSRSSWITGRRSWRSMRTRV